ncbi:MAG: HAMP domain-containing histidine kinase [Bacteroidales bacterium]|nr:HAMP domain-containing histidine kinase [Bacteroidales bacterium]MCF8386573.1 HAMP domain-containing histidine kinase [Bacteroidales bacterium]MCF8397786.1 HAMP domain-containing histidine kinase [Bacteroidales bacterium]
MKDHAINGLAVLCEESGKIEKVLRDDFGALQNAGGKQFSNIIDPGSREKSLNFILEIKKKNIAFDYQLNMLIDQKLKTLYFIGIHLDEKIMLIGADNHKEALEFTNHLQQISNEQANQIRDLLKQQAIRSNNNDKETAHLFDELTRLNNELVNLQRELSKKNIELEKLNDLKNQFMGMAAHDMRNPLGIIQNYTEFLIEEIADDLEEDHRMFLNTIYESTDFMLKLIEDLLDYSKVESGKIQLNPSSFDLVELMLDNIKLNQSLANKKDIRIHFEHPGKIPIYADQHKLVQVLNNLLSNAIKFSENGSNINVKLLLEGNKITLRVKDEGIGIKEEDLEKLFVPFSKISSTGTGGEKGTGLGLSIVKKIIESHNGSIQVKSKYGEGTEFSIHMPTK